MKKKMAAFALFSVLFAWITVFGEAVPAWKEMWNLTSAYEKREEPDQKQKEPDQKQKEPDQKQKEPDQEQKRIETNLGETKTGAGEERRKAEPVLSLYAQSAVLMDGDSGRILYGKNESEIRPMASTTKIMTCILALESGHGEDVVTFSKNASAQPQVHLGAPSGRRFYLKDLLYSLMLESHNDTAVAIAEHIGGSVEGFGKMMNQKARDIGCTTTCFITPNGLDGKGTDLEGKERIHSTTAGDLARIMRYCIFQSPKKEEFLAITGTDAYVFSDEEEKTSYSCVNHNALLNMMEGAFSGKTGFTGEAGYCYVGALERDGRTFIIALLGCGWPPHKTYKWSDARALFGYGLDHYSYRNVWVEPVIPNIFVKNGIPKDEDISRDVWIQAEVDGSQALGEDGKKELLLLLREDEQPEISVHIEKRLEAPVYPGDAVGWVEYDLNGETAAVYPILLKEGVRKADFWWCLCHIAKSYGTFAGEWL